MAELAASPAVALFIDRARAVHPGFTLTPGNAAAVAEICRRLEGLPLAIELAAARTRLLDPGTLLRRLAASFDALGTGAVDLPERQRTLRATVEWSVGLLDDAERSLLEIMAVFVDGWTIEAAAHIASLDEDRALELSEALAQHSLIYLDGGEASPRSRMLETIRAFVAERLAARADAGEIGRRHAGYYRALAERADRPLRRAGHGALLDRMQAEAGNLAAAVRSYLGNDHAPLPHLFRVLLSFWFLRGHMPEARGSVDRLLPAAARWPAGPRRADVGRGGDRRRDGRRCSGAGGPPTPGTAARDDRGPVPARGRPCWRWRGPHRSPATTTAPGGRRRRAWRSSAARTSPSGRRRPAPTSAPCRRPWAVTTTRCGTCVRCTTWRSASTTPGWLPGPRC